MAIWTLAYNGTEKAIADWGLVHDDFEAQFSNKANSAVMFKTNERFDPGAPQFTSFPAWFRANPSGNPASQLVRLYRDRDSVGSGGTIYFAGYFDDPTRALENGIEHIKYALRDIFWLFERNPFKQYRKQLTAYDFDTGPTYIDVVCPEIFLGENWSTGGLFKQSEQIQEIIDWMNESYNPTKRGSMVSRDDTKDVVAAGTLNPAAKIPITRVNTIFCSDAMTNVLRWAPDAVYKIDHTTTPPTLHVVTMAKWNYATDPPTFVDYTNLPEVTINITAQQEKKVQIQTQAARQLPGVVIYYLSSDTVDGVTAPILVRDAFPGGTSDFYPEVPSHAVDLAGSNLTHVKCNAETEAIADPVSGSAGAKKAWWKKYDHMLNDPKVKDSTIVCQAATVKDDAGADVDLGTYPRRLLKPLPQWVKDQYDIVTIRAHVRAEVAYERYVDDAQQIKEFKKEKHFLTEAVTLTNAETQLYQTVESFESGEIIPTGVAESVYRAVALAQNAGTIELRDDQLRSDIYIGCRLKLVGPTTTFSNILPQQISAKPCQGITTVTFGPSASIDAEALIELAKATRFRLIYRMPSGRSDGGLGDGTGDVDHTLDPPRENTRASEGGNSLISAVFQQS